MHDRWVVAFDEIRLVAVPAKKRLKLLVTNARQDRRIGDFIAVEMQDRQHRAVMHRIEKLVGMPAGCERSRFCFAVADDGGDDEVGVVEGRAEGVRQRIAKLAALMDRARASRAPRGSVFRPETRTE